MLDKTEYIVYIITMQVHSNVAVYGNVNTARKILNTSEVIDADKAQKISLGRINPIEEIH